MNCAQCGQWSGLGRAFGLCMTGFEGGHSEVVGHCVWFFLWMSACLAVRNISLQLFRFVKMPERTTIVFSDDNYFTAKAGSQEFRTDGHTALLRMCEHGSCEEAATTLEKIVRQQSLRTSVTTRTKQPRFAECHIRQLSQDIRPKNSDGMHRHIKLDYRHLA